MLEILDLILAQRRRLGGRRDQHRRGGPAVRVGLSGMCARLRARAHQGCGLLRAEASRSRLERCDSVAALARGCGTARRGCWWGVTALESLPTRALPADHTRSVSQRCSPAASRRLSRCDSRGLRAVARPHCRALHWREGAAAVGFATATTRRGQDRRRRCATLTQSAQCMSRSSLREGVRGETKGKGSACCLLRERVNSKVRSSSTIRAIIAANCHWYAPCADARRSAGCASSSRTSSPARLLTCDHIETQCKRPLVV